MKPHEWGAGCVGRGVGGDGKRRARGSGEAADLGKLGRVAVGDRAVERCVRAHEWSAQEPLGAGPAAGLPTGKVPPLIATEEGRARALAEQAALAQEYPNFVMDVDTDDGTLYVSGVIGPNEHLEAAYRVLVLFPPGYGRGVMPFAYVEHPPIRQDAPHLYDDGSLCLDHSGAFTERSTVVTLLAWVSVWLVLYEGWLQTGQRW